MVILGQDGEKWACEACLKGHRVSSCTHRDRQLFHVNKKGRPVSQCPHCRGLRKSRSAHNRCVCAEHGLTKDDKSGGGRCGCMTDKQPCTCSVKRESLPSDDLQKAAARNLTHRRAHSHGKPSMLSRRSDSGPPRPQLGQHPPLQRHNNAAHDSGFPYTIPKFTTSTPTIADLCQSSTDSLPLPPVPRLGGLHRASLSTSNLPQSFAPMLPSNAPQDHGRSVSIGHRAHSVTSLLTPSEDYQDNGYLSAASPAHPERYSYQDLSSFSFPDFGGDNNQFSGQTVWSQPVPQYGVYRHTPFAASTGQLPEWPELSDAESPQNYPPSTVLETPQRSSVVSMDQPGLTHSPSNTASDAESYAHHHEHTAQTAPQPALMQPRPWNIKDFVDPQSLDVGPASYTSTATDLPFRTTSDNDYWPDYFHSGVASSSTPESVQTDVHIKTEDGNSMPQLSSAPGFENVDFGGNMAEMNFNAWDTFTVQHSGSQSFGHHS